MAGDAADGRLSELTLAWLVDVLSRPRTFVDRYGHVQDADAVDFAPGLTNREFVRVESHFNIHFPPDLRSFLAYALPVSAGFANWRDGDERALRRMLDWPEEGIWYDVIHADFWPAVWGSRPADLEVAVTIAAAGVARAPRLIPIFGHRYAVSGPESGNPILSVWQTDIIYWSPNLTCFLADGWGRRRRSIGSIERVKRVPFWSDIVEMVEPRYD